MRYLVILLICTLFHTNSIAQELLPPVDTLITFGKTTDKKLHRSTAKMLVKHMDKHEEIIDKLVKAIFTDAEAFPNLPTDLQALEAYAKEQQPVFSHLEFYGKAIAKILSASPQYTSKLLPLFQADNDTTQFIALSTVRATKFRDKNYNPKLIAEITKLADKLTPETPAAKSVAALMVLDKLKLTSPEEVELLKTIMESFRGKK